MANSNVIDISLEATPEEFSSAVRTLVGKTTTVRLLQDTKVVAEIIPADDLRFAPLFANSEERGSEEYQTIGETLKQFSR